MAVSSVCICHGGIASPLGLLRLGVNVRVERRPAAVLDGAGGAIHSVFDGPLRTPGRLVLVAHARNKVWATQGKGGRGTPLMSSQFDPLVVDQVLIGRSDRRAAAMNRSIRSIDRSCQKIARIVASAVAFKAPRSHKRGKRGVGGLVNHARGKRRGRSEERKGRMEKRRKIAPRRRRRGRLGRRLALSHGPGVAPFPFELPNRIASWWLAFLGVKAAEEGRGVQPATRQMGGAPRAARCRWPVVGGGGRRIDSFISRLTSFKIRFDFKKPKKRLERNWSFAHSGSRVQNTKKARQAD